MSAVVNTVLGRCPLCSEEPHTPFFSLSNAPVTCASVFAKRAEALAVPCADVSLVVCRQCGFVFNERFEPALGEIGALYESSQSASAQFSTYARTLAETWVQRYDLSGKTVIEVGCGSGDFLKALLEAGVGSAIGIDPLAPAAAAVPAATFIAEAFDASARDLPGEALISRHTLEHVQDVSAFLGEVRAWAESASNRVVLFEVPDAQRIFEERAFWDIYYEHCNYFTEETLRLAFERIGFQVVRMARAFNDQYLILEAIAQPNGAMSCTWPDAQSARVQCQAFGRDVRESTRRCEQALAELASAGAPLVIWQGASKTVGFLSALSSYDCIDSAVDLSPQRHGKFLPGSGLAVHAPEKLTQLQPRHVVLMNPVYVKEVQEHILRLGVDAQVYTVNDLLSWPRSIARP